MNTPALVTVTRRVDNSHRANVTRRPLATCHTPRGTPRASGRICLRREGISTASSGAPRTGNVTRRQSRPLPGERSARLQRFESSDRVTDDHGVDQWAAAEAPDYDDVREEVERAFNVWLAPIDPIAWSDGRGGSVVQNVPFHAAQPTDRIEFRASGTPDDAPPTSVDLVRFDAGDEASSGSAPTRAEYDAQTAASWTLVADEWYCDGLYTPGGANGTVTVARL